MVGSLLTTISDVPERRQRCARDGGEGDNVRSITELRGVDSASDKRANGDGKVEEQLEGLDGDELWTSETYRLKIKIFYARGPQCLDNVTVWELTRHIR
jgi:hypothetical protein